MINWYLKVVKENYANFKGRASRSEYWYFALVNMIAIIVLSIVAGVLKFPYLLIIYYLGILIPLLAVTVRRLHDVGKSGWFYFIGLIPFGLFYILYLFCIEGTSGENEYGADPLTDMPDFDFEKKDVTV